MAQQRVFVVMQRTDIPDSVLQMTELKPNDSQRNYIYDPPGQTQYVKNIPANDTVSTTGATPRTLDAASSGLAAYFLDHVEDAVSLDAVTDAVANAAAAAVVALAQAGSAVDLAAIDAELITAGAGAGTGLTAGNSTGAVIDVLGILAGRVYTVPAGAIIDTAGGIFNTAVSGSFTNDDDFKQLFETSAFKISNGAGQILGFKRTDFDYLGTEAPAVTVYAEDGTLL